MKKLLILALAACSFSTVGCVDEEAPSFEDTNINAVVADDLTLTPDQASTVTITNVSASVPGHLVIHEGDGGTPGPVIGNTFVDDGQSPNVEVALSRPAVDGETLFAMLHVDSPADGEYTFGENAEEDVPAVDADGAVVVDPFTITIETEDFIAAVMVSDQTADPADMVTIDSVTAAVPGYIVIHEFDDNGELVVAPDLGSAAVSAGTTTDLTITLTRDVEDGEMLAAMLHSEDNGNDTYDGAGTDAPVTDANGDVITPTFMASLSPVASVTVADQTADPANMVVVAEVYAERAGYIVIHDEDENGDLIVAPEVGVAAVAQGMNTDVMVTLNRPVFSGETLYAMLHTEDGGDASTYDGAGTDAPVADSNGDVITPAFTATAGTSEPFVTAMDQLADPADMVTIRQTLFDSAGWIVIHEADANGMPGTVLGQTALTAGVNQDVDVGLSRNAVSGETLFAMLHSDDGDGVYEFPGPDGPVTNGAGDVVTPAFTVTTPENTVMVSDQTLSTVSTIVTIDGAYALRDGYIVIHEDDGGSFGATIGVGEIDPGMNGTVEITLDRPAVDGETLWAMLHTEDGGDPTSYDGAGTDLPATDSSGNVVTPTFVATVPSGTPAVVLTVDSQGSTSYLFASAVPASYFDEVVGGTATTPDPTLTLRQGWRYAFELGATAGPHPIQFGTNGITALGDDWKLVQGNGGDNTFELNANINWVDSGGTVTFTVTQDVVDDAPDYQCQVHGGMLGQINYTM